MRQFFKGVPDELEESAYVDGAGTMRTFFQIILPLAVPMMITIFLFAFSWQWTDEFYTTLFFSGSGANAKIYLMPDVYIYPPESLETNYAGQTLYYNVIQNTAGMMIIMPLIILYLFCQKYLVQGIERSGLVG
jgi:multiple sugar transport system permease protein